MIKGHVNLTVSQNLWGNIEQAIGRYLHSPGGRQGSSSSEGSSDGPTDSSCQRSKTANNISGLRHVCITIRLTDYSCSTLASMREVGWPHITEQQLRQIKTAHMTGKNNLNLAAVQCTCFYSAQQSDDPVRLLTPSRTPGKTKTFPSQHKNMSV